MTGTKLVSRFAPSPSGYLHLGHAYSALFAQAAASGRRCLLRIEDIDQTRCKPEFTKALIEDLDWLGLTWEQPVRIQSQHFDTYTEALERLDRLAVVYPCFCTRRDIAEATAAPHHGPDGLIYPGTCRHLSADERAEQIGQGSAFSYRLDINKALALTGPLTFDEQGKGIVTAAPQDFGDVVLARKDVPTSYHLSVTVDDALQGVTLVTRGQDLFRATDIHRLLQALLNLPTPAYRHHPLLTDAAGKRYAKRDKALTLRALCAAGKTPADVRAMLPPFAAML